MESQESDIVGPEDMRTLLEDEGISSVMFADDWINAAAPGMIVNPTGEMPAREQWMGPHFFDAKVDTSGIHKKSYVVSTKLNRVYVNLGNVVPLQIKWDGTPNLYVRALMMFSQADRMRSPVQRCLMHKDKEDPTNSRYAHSEHVLATENDNATYQVDPLSQRYSVTVPLHLQIGCDHALINYKFMCKTSCIGGLNRCPTDVIFTLEDDKGMVLGRQNLGVKICSCPKRDKDKDESNLAETSSGKRKMKIKKEDKAAHRMPEEPDLKRVKQEFVHSEMHPQCTFMVTAVSPETANRAKEHLRKWAEVESYERALPGVAARTMPIAIIDDIAVLPQPYI